MKVDLSRPRDCVWNQPTGKAITQQARYSTLKLFLAQALSELPHKLVPVRSISQEKCGFQLLEAPLPSPENRSATSPRVLRPSNDMWRTKGS